MSLKVALLSALVAAALARPENPPPSYGPPAPSYHAPAPSYHAPAPSYPDAPPKYEFNYAVQDDYSGNAFNAQEARDGYDTQGAYYVQLPDGRIQKVTYSVSGDSGFVADVTYEGEAKYPEKSYAPAPSYGKPAPSYGTPAPSYGTPAPSYA